MKFEDIDFMGKNKVCKHARYEIKCILSHSLDMDKLSVLCIDRYLEILISDQDYNPKSNVFYDRRTGRKLNFTFLASIAHDYISEHTEDFVRMR